ncbi:hypothetical protein INT44_006693 [Umbelopsis vinacea]|uniref:Uncharacterized protein n=1 Tax=Umbelopsis vinacea TaxID=44442 RepID=A0A8H7PDJ3_9FUNG|nr:hypothetical protein INT44_006693 [Umbelopsis vinacea]
MDILPNDVVDYLRLFQCTSSQALRKVCLENQAWYYPFDGTEHFYHDWIRRTIDMLSVKLPLIYLMVFNADQCWFEISIVEFESGSLKIQHYESWYMVRIWSMIDRIFADVEGLEAVRKGLAEYGCAEAGAKDEGIWGTKKLPEKDVKAAKTLKDMMNHLSDFVGNEESSVRQLRTIGYILSGLLLMVTKVEWK